MNDPRDESPAFDGEPAPLEGRAGRLLAAAAAPRPLPATLRSRLLAVPTATEAEDEEVRRFERAKAAGLAAAASGAPPRLETAAPGRPARTERAIAGFIAASRRPAALPELLRRRLVGIGRAARRPLPFWLVDLRFATAACLLLTLFSTVMAEDALALLGPSAAKADGQSEEWWAGLEERVGEASEGAAAAIRRVYFDGSRIFIARAETLRDLFEEKLRLLKTTGPDRSSAGEPATREGNSHGKP